MIVIPVKSKTYGEKYFFIDGCDFEKIKDYKWHLTYSKNIDNMYVQRTCHNIKKNIKLHRFIMNCPVNLTVDHIDGNTLNNCQSNLRICTKSENNRNTKKQKINITSKYKGVSFVKNRQKSFMSRICFENKRIFLGWFYTEKEAALKYNEAAIKYHGVFAQLNIITEE